MVRARSILKCLLRLQKYSRALRESAQSSQTNSFLSSEQASGTLVSSYLTRTVFPIWVSRGYIREMFVRQKRNQSGSISVQVIDKSNGYRVVQTIGTAVDPVEVARLVELGKLFIVRQSGQYTLFPESQHDHAVILDFVETLGNASIRTVGPELIFGRLFDAIGLQARFRNGCSVTLSSLDWFTRPASSRRSTISTAIRARPSRRTASICSSIVSTNGTPPKPNGSLTSIPTGFSRPSTSSFTT